MRFLALVFSLVLLAWLPAAAQSASSEDKVAVTLDVDAALLRYAREKNLDLSALMERQLRAELGIAAAAAQTHQALLTASFDTFEAMMFAPLGIDHGTPATEVRRVCQSVNDNLERLVAHAQARESMSLPNTLEEARELDQYLANRFQAFQARMGKDGSGLRNSGKILETACPDLKANGPMAQQAMKTALAGYGPVGWCRAMTKKPQAQWNLDDAGKFAKYCPGVKTN